MATHLAGAIENVLERAGVSNDVCWQGAMNDFASVVVKTCEDAVRLSPKNIGYLTDAAVAYARVSDRNTARERFLLAVQLAAQSPDRAAVSHEICWQAAMNGFASEFVKTCDDAVLLSKNVNYLTEAAIAYAVVGDRNTARDRFLSAVEMAANAVGPGKASLNNQVCWRGAIYDFAFEVRPACDAAVAMEKNATARLAYLDSQGVAYALIGTPDLLKRAKENFKTFVEAAKGRSESVVEKRKNWYAQLEKGRNPFKLDRRAVLAGLAKDLEAERERVRPRRLQFVVGKA
jgi:hypothetical protein